MRRRTINKILFITLLLFIIVWTAKIIRVNINDKYKTQISEMNESLLFHGLEISITEANLLDVEEYAALMNNSRLDLYYAGELGEKIIYVRINVKNSSGKEMSWDEVFSNMGIGFESDKWCSVTLPLYTSALNHVYEQSFMPGKERTFWMGTGLDPVSFGEKAWNIADTFQYYYVLDVWPDSRKVKLRFNNRDI